MLSNSKQKELLLTAEYNHKEMGSGAEDSQVKTGYTGLTPHETSH